jgi:hypothetical protein
MVQRAGLLLSALRGAGMLSAGEDVLIELFDRAEL